MSERTPANKKDMLRQALMQALGDYVTRSSNRKSLVTVTDCQISRDRAYATFSISVYPENDTGEMLAFLDRHRDDARDYIREHVRTRTIPFVRYRSDAGEIHRSRIYEVMNAEDFLKKEDKETGQEPL